MENQTVCFEEIGKIIELLVESMISPSVPYPRGSVTEG
jgi:hypothetical protein